MSSLRGRRERGRVRCTCGAWWCSAASSFRAPLIGALARAASTLAARSPGPVRGTRRRAGQRQCLLRRTNIARPNSPTRSCAYRRGEDRQPARGAAARRCAITARDAGRTPCAIDARSIASTHPAARRIHERRGRGAARCEGEARTSISGFGNSSSRPMRPSFNAAAGGRRGSRQGAAVVPLHAAHA